MKIIITEDQLSKIIDEAVPLSDKEVKKRLEKSKKLAVNFKNPRQFELKYPLLWRFLRNKNLLDDVFPDRQKYKQDGYWNELTVSQEAEKYKSRSDFSNANQVAYNKARDLGILDFLFPSYMKIKPKKYTDEYIRSEVEKHGSRRELHHNNKNLYQTLVNNKLLDVYFPDKYNNPMKKLSYWTPEEIQKIKDQYLGKTDIQLKNQKLYLILKDLDLLDKIFPERLNVKGSKYTIDFFKDMVNNQYGGDFKKFREENTSLYYYIINHGYISHFDTPQTKKKRYLTMSDEELKNFAESEYQSIDDIFKYNKTLFYVLKSKGFITRKGSFMDEPTEPVPVSNPVPEKKSEIKKTVSKPQTSKEKPKITSNVSLIASQYDSFDEFSKDYPNLADIIKDNRPLFKKLFPNG